MTINRLDVHSVRNITYCSLSPSQKFNIIVGPNGSGKSSLLESIFLLGRARSFRTTTVKQLIQFEQPHAIVSSRIHTDDSDNLLGVQIDHKQTTIHLNREKASLSDIAYCLPLQLIHPKSYKLLDGGSQLRREFIDWGVFNQQQDFLQVWRDYKKTLQHRNKVLKLKDVKQLSIWDKRLSDYAQIVIQYRIEYVEQLKKYALALFNVFLPAVDCSLQFLSGWDNNITLLEQLASDKERDLRYGFTQSGPHRSDFRLLTHNLNVKDVVSRGQLKLFVLALKLAQIQLFSSFNKYSVCILIDDLTAELDTANKSKLLKYLYDSNCQVFMTSTELDSFGDLSLFDDYKVFHVKQGEVNFTDVSRET